MTMFSEAAGRPVLSRASAEHIGDVKHFIVDVEARQVSGITVGKGKNSAILPWARITGFGPDAVMADTDDAVVPPASDMDKAAVAGKLQMLKQRVLSDHGFLQGSVSDVEFDPDTGALIAIHTTTTVISADQLRGAGSYAVVVATS